MKIFSTNEWPAKTNFIDENNLVVGWDDGQSCCERVGYFFARLVANRLNSGLEFEPAEAELG